MCYNVFFFCNFAIMKKYTLILTLTLFSFNLFAQKISTKDIMVFDTSVFINDLKVESFRNLIACYKDDTLFFIDYQKRDKKDSLNIFAYPHVKNKYYIKSIYTPNIEFSKSSSIEDISVNDKYLAILIFEKLLVYERKNNGDFIYLKSFEVDHSITNCRFLPNGKIILFKNYLGYKCSKEETTRLSLMDIENGKIIKTIFPYFALSGFSYFEPKRLIEVTDNSILYSQVGEYKIIEFDFDLNIIDTISNPNVKWKRMKDKEMNKILEKYPEAAERIYYLDKWDYLSSKIYKILYNKNYLYVFYGEKRDEDKRSYLNYDIWRKKSKGWELIKEKIKDYDDNKENRNSQNFILPFADPLLFSGSYFIRIIQDTPIRKKEYKSNEEYKKALTDYLLNNNYVYSIQTFRIKL